MTEKPPYLKLSFFYLTYFAALGSFVPYWSVYLKELNFNAIEIGQLMSIFMLSKLLAPLVWGWITDHSGKRLKWIRLAAFLCILGVIPLFFRQSYAWIAWGSLFFGFFWNASLPQYEALTLNHLGSKTNQYSWIRLWGSIGFIMAVALLPFLFDLQGIEVLPSVMLAFFVLIWVSTWLIKDKSHTLQEGNSDRFKHVMKHPMVIALLLACVLQTASHGAYYTFFSIYLEDQGYSRVFIGWMWALGVVAEVILFMLVYRLFVTYRAYQLFAFSLLLTSVRWLLLATIADKLIVLVFSQLLHAASYGLFHASAIHLIHDWFPGRLQGRGQAFYAGLSFGLGGAIGSIISGYLWELTSTTISFMVMAVLALLAWLISIMFIRKSSLWNV